MKLVVLRVYFLMEIFVNFFSQLILSLDSVLINRKNVGSDERSRVSALHAVLFNEDGVQAESLKSSISKSKQ